MESIYYNIPEGTSALSSLRRWWSLSCAAHGQVETHSVDGNVEVAYPDGTVRRILCTGEEEQKTPDGIVARRLRDGTETIDYPNGQKEVRSEHYRVISSI
ncbi:hypothetical protein HPB51_009325 [Rhipicephalus microplus]|uniref:Centromere protein J C-terminal domain-containing protein n=1 Tax=Rhipicephalus microplus TaxID=6941 RepID=A0A9J6F0W1_RHIMP|nr:hypothetical protein HPB51_009325 [Rhipicephalus microplus]